MGNCPVCLCWSEAKCEYLHRLRVCPLCSLLPFLCAKDPNRVHLLGLCGNLSGVGQERHSWFVSNIEAYWSVHVYLESPLWQSGAWVLQNESKKIRWNLAKVEQEGKWWAPALYITWRRNVGQPGPGRTSVQPQPQIFKCTLDPKLNFCGFCVFCCFVGVFCVGKTKTMVPTCLQHKSSTLILHFAFSFCTCVYEKEV